MLWEEKKRIAISMQELSECPCLLHRYSLKATRHCVGPDVSESSEEPRDCGRRDREYNIPLRVGLLFVVLATSSIAVYAPILMTKVLKLNAEGIIFTIVKQFGTGIIVATALVHVSSLFRTTVLC